MAKANGSGTERRLGGPDQPVPVLRHHRCWTGERHRDRPPQDLPDCSAGVDCRWARRHRSKPRGRDPCRREHYLVCDHPPLPMGFHILFQLCGLFPAPPADPGPRYSTIMLKSNTEAPEVKTSSTNSVVPNAREVRARLAMGLRALQPGDWAQKARFAVEGYVDFVRTTLSSSRT